MKIAKISMKEVAFKKNPLAQGCSVKRPEEFAKKYYKVNPQAYLAPKSQYDACMVKDGVQLLQAKVYKFSDKSISMYVRCPVVHRVNFCPWIYQEDPTRPQLSYSDFELKLDIFETSKKAKLKRANAPVSEIRKASNEPEYFGSFVDLFMTEDGISPSMVKKSGGPNFELALVKVWNEFIVPGVKAGFLVECYSPTDISGVSRARALMHNIEEFMENTPEFTPKAKKPQTLKKGLKMNLSSLFGSSEPEDDEDEDVFTEDAENPPFDSDEEEYDDSEEEYEDDESEYDEEEEDYSEDSEEDEEYEEEEEEPQPVVVKKTKTKAKKPSMDEVLNDLANRF